MWQTSKTSPFIVNLSLYKIQNIHIETCFILILKTRIAKFEGSRCFILKAMRHRGDFPKKLVDVKLLKLLCGCGNHILLMYFITLRRSMLCSSSIGLASRLLFGYFINACSVKKYCQEIKIGNIFLSCHAYHLIIQRSLLFCHSWQNMFDPTEIYLSGIL